MTGTLTVVVCLAIFIASEVIYRWWTRRSCVELTPPHPPTGSSEFDGAATPQAHPTRDTLHRPGVVAPFARRSDR